VKPFIIPGCIVQPFTEPKRRRNGTGKTAAQRQNGTKRALLDAGGKRLHANLPPQSVAHLERIKSLHGIPTDTGAVIFALATAAET
jgi:hypothetical protein